MACYFWAISVVSLGSPMPLEPLEQFLLIYINYKVQDSFVVFTLFPSDHGLSAPYFSNPGLPNTTVFLDCGLMATPFSRCFKANSCLPQGMHCPGIHLFLTLQALGLICPIFCVGSPIRVACLTPIVLFQPSPPAFSSLL